MVAEAIPSPPDAESRVVSIAWVLSVLLAGKRLILGLAATGAVLAATLGLLQKPSFTTEFIFVSQAADDQRESSLAGLAGQFGISLGGLSSTAQSPQFYADLLETRRLLSAVVDDTVTSADGSRVPVWKFVNSLDADTAARREMAIRVLRERVITTSVAARTTGAVTVRVRTGSAPASYQIAQRLIVELNQFNRMSRQSRATEARRFAEQSLKSAREALVAIDDSLLAFKRGNRQFGSASSLVFEQDRLEAEQALRRQIVQSVAQQVEDARLREVRDTPVITMVDAPVPAAVRDPMGRVSRLVLWTIAGGFIGLAIVLARGLWRYRREIDPDFRQFESDLIRLWPFIRPR